MSWFVDNDLFCDAFLLPPELANGEVDVASSLGCVVAIQGLGAAIGYPFNVRMPALAFDVAARDKYGVEVTGPLGTRRP